VQDQIQRVLSANIVALNKPVPQSKLNKMLRFQMSKEYASQRKEYENMLDMLKKGG
jgi:hypothetical protein